MTPTERNRLYKLIDDACTNKQIRALLRAKKLDDKKVRVSGTSPDLMRHLKEAYDRGVLREDELIQLLAGGEENGRQHIFFYRPRQQARAHYKDVRLLRQKLIRETGINAARLPHFVLDPTERTLSDIRLEPLPNDDFNLIVKWYSGRTIERFVSKETFKRHGETFVRRIVKIDNIRLVSMVRYLPRGLLEIRVPTGERESRKTCLKERDEIRQIIGGIFDPDHFIPLHLTKAMRWLVTNNGRSRTKHRISAAQAADGEARAEFNPAMEGEDLFASARHREAMKEYEDYAGLDVYWQPSLRAEDVDDETRCQIAVYERHGIRLGAKRTVGEVDFVVNRLWELSK